MGLRGPQPSAALRGTAHASPAGARGAGSGPAVGVRRGQAAVARGGGAAGCEDGQGPGLDVRRGAAGALLEFGPGLPAFPRWSQVCCWDWRGHYEGQHPLFFPVLDPAIDSMQKRTVKSGCSDNVSL